MSSLRIAYVCGNPTYHLDDPSGYATHIRELSGALEALGHRVSIHMPCRYLVRADMDASCVGKSTLKKMTPSILWESLKDVRRLYSDTRFSRIWAASVDASEIDLIYERMDTSGPVAMSWAHKNKKPYVVEIHAPLDLEARLITKTRPMASLFFRRVKRALAKADGVVTVSGVIKNWLMDANVPAERIVVVPNAVNLDLFFFQESPTPTPEIVVGYVGSALKWHGLMELLEGVAMARKSVPMRLMIVGMSKFDTQLQQEVVRLGIQDAVDFTGPVPHTDVPMHLRKMDIAVMAASNSYGSPIKIFEYGALGKAIVAPKTPPVEEVMKHNEDGILIPSGDVQALSDALIYLAQDSGVRKRLGMTFMRKVRSHYGWSHAATRVSDFLYETVKNYGRTRESKTFS